MKNDRKTIIMVDDDIINLTVVENALSGIYNIFAISSGKRLFQLLESITPDLILLDIEMPEMDGHKVLAKLKASTETSDIPVILLTPTIDPASLAKGLITGAVDYITKPFSPRLLFKRIEMHLLIEKQRRALRQNNAAAM